MQKELVFIGLGRMGAAMTEHLVEAGYTVHGYDTSEESRATAAKFGVINHNSTNEAIGAMAGRKVVWLMVPAQFVDQVIDEIHPLLTAGDIIIDGGNTFFKDTIRRAEQVNPNGIHYVDCGTSGGVTGARYGASLMVGGEAAAVSSLEQLFLALAAPGGYGHVGQSGAGHFVKMVHNGIEYGIMGAIAEGLAFIEQNADELSINTKETLKPYENGSIISSKLMTWMAEAYNTKGYLEQISGEVPRGETEIEMEFIVNYKQTPVLEAALKQRKETRVNPSRIGTLLSAMRNLFGGHNIIKK